MNLLEAVAAGVERNLQSHESGRKGASTMLSRRGSPVEPEDLPDAAYQGWAAHLFAGCVGRLPGSQRGLVHFEPAREHRT